MKEKNIPIDNSDIRTTNIPIFPLKQRIAISIIFTVIIGIFLAVAVVATNIATLYKQLHIDMISGMHSAALEYENTINEDAIYQSAMMDVARDSAGYIAFVFEQNGYSKVTRDMVDSQLRFANIYFYQGTFDNNKKIFDGSIRSSADTLELTNDELYDLFNKGQISVNSPQYIKDNYGFDFINLTSCKLHNNSGYVVISWIADDIMQTQSVMSAYSSDDDEYIARVNKKTLMIEDCNHTDLIGVNFSTIMSIDRLKDNLDDAAISVKLNDGSKAMVVTCDETDGMLFCSFIKIKNFIPELIRNILIPIVLGWFFLLMFLIYVIRFSTNNENSNHTVEYVHIVGNKSADKRLVSHLGGIVIFAIFLIFIALFYLQILINFSYYNSDSSQNLSALDSLIKISESNYDIMTADFIASYTQNVANCISEYYMTYPDQLSENNVNKLNSYLPDINNIVIFDKNGTSEFNTSGAVGYTLSNSESDPEYKIWDVIYGRQNGIGYYSSLSNNEFIVASRRQDKGGAVELYINSTILPDFNQLVTIDKVIKSANFGNSLKGYIDKLNPTTLYTSQRNEDIYQIPISLNNEILADGYSGIATFNGTKYLVNVKETDSYYLLSALRTLSVINDYNIYVYPVILFVFLLEHILYLFIGLVTTDEKNTKIEHQHRPYFIDADLDERMMDASFRQIVRNMLIATGIVIVIFLGIDSLYGSTSLLKYLFGSQWPKKLNLFSITMILIMSVSAIIVGKILSTIVLFFTKSMGQRGLTIGRMSTSVIRFAILIFVIISILIDIGADPTKLLAGAGIVGGMISFCAQQTVNDLLSGFFIVFEGAFNVGDWITINDFRGQVIEIGVRTTKITVGGVIKVINNSELRNVSIMAKNGTGAICNIDIAYEEDANAVINLIKRSEDIYTNEIPEIIEGPYVDGIVELGDSGVTLYIWALADADDVRRVEREMRRVTKNIFDENGIDIPFNQVTIHTGK